MSRFGETEEAFTPTSSSPPAPPSLKPIEFLRPPLIVMLLLKNTQISIWPPVRMWSEIFYAIHQLRSQRHTCYQYQITLTWSRFKIIIIKKLSLQISTQQPLVSSCHWIRYIFEVANLYHSLKIGIFGLHAHAPAVHHGTNTKIKETTFIVPEFYRNKMNWKTMTYYAIILTIIRYD